MATITWSDVTTIASGLCDVPPFAAIGFLSIANSASLCGLPEQVERVARSYLAAHYAALSVDAAESSQSSGESGAVTSRQVGSTKETYADGGGVSVVTPSVGLNATKWGKLYLQITQGGGCSAGWIAMRA